MTQTIDLSARRHFTVEDLKPFEAPQMLLDICPEAESLWAKFFNRVDIGLLFKYGFDDLMFRMSCQVQRERTRHREPDYENRARVWYHIVNASSSGKSEIPDFSDSDLAAWMPTTKEQITHAVSCFTCGKRYQAKMDSKFGSCKKCRGNKLRVKQIEKTVRVEGELPEGFIRCEMCAEPFKPTRTDARCCTKVQCVKQRAAGRQKVVRERKLLQNRAICPILPSESYVSAE